MLDTLALRALIALVVCMGLVTGGMYYGHTRYREGVRVTKLEWDTDRATWQAALDKQKHDALQLLVSTQADVDAANLKAQKLAAQKDKDYATYMQSTADLARQYQSRELRFRTQAAPAPRCGSGGGPAVSGAASQAQPAAGTVVQLPDPVASNLRQLTVDADNLRNAYSRCVAAVNGGPSL
jgi:hypothetical protein